jgi:hypothetical protein
MRAIGAERYFLKTNKYFLGGLILWFAAIAFGASERHGFVKFGGLPLPGATVTASQGDKKIVTVTDPQGAYSFADLPEGAWTIEVEMLCFAPVKQDVTLAADAVIPDWDMKLLPLDQIKAVAGPIAPPVTTGVAVRPAETGTDGKPSIETTAKAAPKPAKRGKTPPPASNTPGGFQRADVNASNSTTAAQSNAAATAAAENSASSDDLNKKAADGFLVNGTSNNGASSPFATSPAFGNNRGGIRSLYNGNIGFTLDNSALDARTYSITGQDTPKPGYNHFTGLASFGGPLRIPHLLPRGGPNFFINYQWTRNTNALSQNSGLMPTAAQRAGDFSLLPASILDPATNLPFPNNMIPQTRISPQARALLGLYPLPNFSGNQYNYQVPLVGNQHQDSLQARLNKSINRKNQVFGTYAFQSTRGYNPTLLGFIDSTDSLGMRANANWRHSFTNRFFATFGYEFTRFSSRTTPNFANKENISAEAGITGNNQEPQNWGPPGLIFSSGITSLNDAQSSILHNQTNGVSDANQWIRGRHNVSFGADYKKQQFNLLSQSDPRGQFTFNGAATGNDFAGFLLGIPDTSAIAFGNADKYLRSSLYDAYIADDLRVNPSLTLNVGVRWEYNSPMTELFGRLVNLDVAPGYSAVSPVAAYSPKGSLTGVSYPDSLVHPDKHAFQPRIGLSWRPLPASSMVVRAGYGVNYNTSVYQSIAAQMDQQSPLSKSLSVSNSATDPLTLANGFNAPPNLTTNTFAIDPHFRIGYVQTWQVSLQRDLPGALIMTATYLGNKGTRQVQEFLPNTYPKGAAIPCLSCPAGFTYMTSNGNSTREAGTIQVRRRLHNGFTASVQYVYSKSIDDAALGGQGQGRAVIAQNWLDLSAERGLSTFDQRHVVNIQGQYTSGMGLHGGSLLSGWRGQLLKEWTILTQINTGTGTPLTPIYAAATQGTGVTGPIRPDYTGADVYNAPAGRFLNPLAYAAPQLGQWGNAGRDSITGPFQFSLGASLQRTFRLTDRLSLNLRVDSTNTLNHVTYPSWGTTINSSQFGIAGSANPMRSLATRVQVNF